MRYRAPSKNNDHYLPLETYLTAVHFARQYPQWVQELRTLPDSGGAIRYDKDKVQTSNQYDPNAELAMRRYEVAKKKEMIDQIASEVAGNLHEWLILSVCYGMYYYQLRDRGMPCGQKLFTALRQKFYSQLSQKI